MGISGMALPWQITMARPACPNSIGAGQKKRPEKHLFGTHDPANSAASSDEALRQAETRAADSALAAGCRGGRIGAYEELYRAHGTRLKSLAMNLLGNRHDAEDAVQETFLKVHRSIGSFKGESSFATWVYRILVNTCYDARRKRVRRQEMPEEDAENSKFPEAPAPAANPPLRMAIERSLARLSAQQRDVFLLAEVEGFKHSEIGGILGISEAASKNALFQAKKHLRQMLTEPGGAASSANR
jgi:RNA polymerase sigma-70 factor, ECF subfamily